MSKWTQFMDMHSGGGRKTEYEYIYIEAEEYEATRIFRDMFDQSPDDIACDCCGSNFSVSEYESLDSATKYERTNYRTKEVEPLDDYVKRSSVLVVRATNTAVLS